MRRIWVVPLVLGLVGLTPATPAGAALTAGDLVVMERTADAQYRAIADGRGGQWYSGEHGIGRRGRPPFTTDRTGHLAAVPATGDLVYEVVNEVRHLTRAGVRTVLAEVEGNITGIDVATDGDIYVSNGPSGIDRIDADGNVERVVTTEHYVEAVAVDEDDESLLWFSGGRLYRDGEVIAGDGTHCTAPDPCGDDGPATSAGLGAIIDIEIHADETIYLADLYGRVRSIRTDGVIRHLAGDWDRCWLMASRGLSCRENIYAPAAALDNVVSMSLEGDILYLVDSRGDGRGNRLMRIGDVTTLRDWQHQGYRMIASDGGVFTFGWAPYHGSTGDIRLVSPIVAGRSNGADGYWFVAADGGVFTFGDAPFFGSAAGRTDSPVVDLAVRRDGEGYAVLERDGSVLFFGRTLDVARPDHGQSAAAIVTTGPEEARVIGERPASLPTLNVPIVAAHATRSGMGIWYVASDGGVFTEGDAGFFGSTGAMRLNQPVLDLIPTPTERGYWLVAADGGVFSFGDAVYQGSMGAVRLNRPVVAGVAGPHVSG